MKASKRDNLLCGFRMLALLNSFSGFASTDTQIQYGDIAQSGEQGYLSVVRSVVRTHLSPPELTYLTISVDGTNVPRYVLNCRRPKRIELPILVTSHNSLTHILKY